MTLTSEPTHGDHAFSRGEGSEEIRIVAGHGTAVNQQTRIKRLSRFFGRTFHRPPPPPSILGHRGASIQPIHPGRISNQAPIRTLTDVRRCVAAYRKAVNQRDKATTTKADRAKLQKQIDRLKREWFARDGDDQLHAAAFGEPIE